MPEKPRFTEPSIALIKPIYINLMPVLLSLKMFGMRKLEACIGAMVGAISICFVAEMFLAHESFEEILNGMIIPRISTSEELYVAISLLGAVVMPHNLYLHSALVLSREIGMSEMQISAALKYANPLDSIGLAQSFMYKIYSFNFILEIQQTSVFSSVFRYNYIESGAALCVSLFINCAVMAVAAATIVNLKPHDPLVQELTESPLQGAPVMLKRVLGSSASSLFGIALLASGQVN